MHVLIIESSMSGHHAGYLDRISRAFLTKGRSVTVAIPDDHKDDSILRELSISNREILKIYPYSIPGAAFLPGSLGRLAARDFALRKTFRAIWSDIRVKREIDYVFLPFADACLYSFALLGSPFGGIPWGGICMRTVFHLPSFGIAIPDRAPIRHLKERLFFRLLKSKNLKHLFSIDELLVEYVSAKATKLDRLLFAPDPSDRLIIEKHDARRILDLPQLGAFILIFGHIDRRKGLDALLAASADKQFPSDVQLLIVGSQSDWAKQLLSSPMAEKLRDLGAIHQIDSFVSERTQMLAFAASDMVWLGYREHYTMSGVLVSAARTGRPVIASKSGLIAWYVDKYRLGMTVNESEPAEVTLAISSMRSQVQASDLSTYQSTHFESNTWEHFLQVVAQ